MVLSKVLVAVSVVDCVTRVAPGERLGTTLAVDVVLRTTVCEEVGCLRRNHGQRVWHIYKLKCTSWMRVPARESVPVLEAFQKAPQMWKAPNLLGYTYA